MMSGYWDTFRRGIRYRHHLAADQWEMEISRLAAAGFDTVVVSADWASCHPAPIRYDFDWLLRLADLAAARGMGIVVGPGLDTAPAWVGRRYPDARYRDDRDRPVTLEPHPRHPGGGWPGLCLEHAGTRHLAGEFLEHLAAAMAGHRALVAWEAWDNPAAGPVFTSAFREAGYCYCPSSQASFRSWLKQVHTTISDLNRAWGSGYLDWDEVEPPRRLGAYPSTLDWLRFRRRALVRQLDWRIRRLKSRRSSLPILVGADAPGAGWSLSASAADFPALAALADLWGWRVRASPGSASIDSALAQGLLIAGYRPCLVTLEGGYGRPVIDTEARGNRWPFAETGPISVPDREQADALAGAGAAAVFWEPGGSAGGGQGIFVISPPGAADRSDSSARIDKPKSPLSPRSGPESDPGVVRAALLWSRDSRHLLYGLTGSEDQAGASLAAIITLAHRMNISLFLEILDRVPDEDQDRFAEWAAVEIKPEPAPPPEWSGPRPGAGLAAALDDDLLNYLGMERPDSLPTESTHEGEEKAEIEEAIAESTDDEEAVEAEETKAERADRKAQEDWSDYRVLFLPLGLVMGEEQVERLHTFVEGGGLLLADGGSGLFDAFGRRGGPEMEKSCKALFGAAAGMIRSLGAEPAEITPVSGSESGRLLLSTPLRASGFRVDLKLDRGNLLATFADGAPALVARLVGQGAAVLAASPTFTDPLNLDPLGCLIDTWLSR